MCTHNIVLTMNCSFCCSHDLLGETTFGLCVCAVPSRDKQRAEDIRNPNHPKPSTSRKRKAVVMEAEDDEDDEDAAAASDDEDDDADEAEYLFNVKGLKTFTALQTMFKCVHFVKKIKKQ